jgi:DNA modification methylase
MGKLFVGIEKDPKYFDIACKRIELAYAQLDMFI